MYTKLMSVQLCTGYKLTWNDNCLPIVKDWEMNTSQMTLAKL